LIRRQKQTNFLLELGARESDVETDARCTPIQTLQMSMQEQQRAAMQPQAFPHAVADDETAVKNRDFRVLARDQRTVQIDDDRCIARIRSEVLAAWHESS
jgi:hypothetical protein